MPDKDFETLSPTALEALDLAQLTASCGLEETVLRELVEYGVLQPLDPAAPAMSFSATQVVVLRRACRLRQDFDLDTPALALALGLLRRIHTLEHRLQLLGGWPPE